MGKMNFLHISDTHYLTEYKDALDRWGVYYNPAQIFEKFLEGYSFEEIDFVIHTGDIVHDGTAEDYRNFKKIIEKHVPDGVPIFYCLGNHDRKEFFKEAYGLSSELSDLYVHVETVNGNKLIFLDTASEEVHHGIISEEQMKWLAEELEKEPEKETVIFQHHPLEISWLEGIEQTEVPEGYIELIQTKGVKGVFTGHLHMNRSYIIQDIPQHTANSFVFGMTTEGKEIWNTNRLGYSEVRIREERVDVFNEIVYPEVTKLNQNIL